MSSQEHRQVQRVAEPQEESGVTSGQAMELQQPWGNQAALSALGLARQGVAGGGTSFPHLDRISAAFGDHELDGVEAFMGGFAQSACGDLGAEAYALGDQVAFTAAPDLWTAAHEAAHVVQQRAGISLEGGAGKSGDAHERMADAVAHRVVAGQSAEHLLPAPVAPTGRVAGVQRYSEETDVNGNDVRVSDDGTMAVKVEHGPDQDADGKPDSVNGSHKFFADEGHLDEWNQDLADKKSVVELDEGTKKYDAFSAGTTGEDDLAEVRAANKSNGTSGDDTEIWADCGKSGRDVMGAGEGEGNGKMTAVYNKERDRTWYEGAKDWLGIEACPEKVMEQKTTTASSPEAMKQEMLGDLLDCKPEDAFAKYGAMTPGERDALDQKAGINQYAAPEVGEGYTMSSGGKSLPVANDADRSHDSDGDGKVDQWNFHWAGVVGKSGDDTVTMENYSVGQPGVQNKDWEHQMYGTGPDQSFHDYHKATKQHGDLPVTMRVRKAE